MLVVLAPKGFYSDNSEALILMFFLFFVNLLTLFSAVYLTIDKLKHKD